MCEQAKEKNILKKLNDFRQIFNRSAYSDTHTNYVAIRDTAMFITIYELCRRHFKGPGSILFHLSISMYMNIKYSYSFCSFKTRYA